MFLTSTNSRSIPIYGWIGLMSMFVFEFLFFQKNAFVGRWMTPLMWTGYILFLDALIYKLKGNSFIRNHFKAFIFMLFYSVFCWLLFELYNLHLQNWRYVGLPENIFIRLLGDAWAFATIFPGVLFTYELIDGSKLFDKMRVPKFKFNKGVLYFIMTIGLLCLIAPIVVSQKVAGYLFVLVWMGFVFFLDPVNYFIGAGSLFRELENGSLSKVFSLFLAGVICGFLWEFWNYWATTKWIYTVPFFQEPKIFEMPLFGFLGFLPFAVEIYVMWEFAVKVFKLDCSSIIRSSS